ncbi:hypothetical protein FGIG_01796 [Fasciola gigantica]|uniref:Nuclear pore complex protein Nup205 n=1 Tax=Fasciola gigantica TaxID=46835 RepID=A0A504YQV9_FASGI|nr:hypothetical protein FGIG_01796 [Fasciola gigantica]
MLEIVDTAMRSDCLTGHGTAEPTRFTLTVHWNLSLIWQILYRLSANQLSSESLLRFLRSNHDLLAKHVQLNLISSFQEIQVNSKPDKQAVLATERLSRRTLLELLSLNRISWMLRILAIEIRDASTGNHRSYALKLLKLFWGELLITEEVEHFPEAKSNAIALLHRLKLSNRVNSPDAFDLRALDAWVVDELITDCELGCPFLQSESMGARKASSLIDPVIIFNRLYAKLLMTRLTSCGPGSMDETANMFAWAAKQRVSDGVPTQLPEFCCSTGTGSDREQFVLLAQDLALLRRWIESRNNYRLILGAGKQAALEGWRQVVEISLGLLVSPAGGALMHALTQSTNSTMLMSMTSDLSGVLGGLDSVRLTGPTATASVRPRAPQLICLDVMSKLLSELCKTNHTPSSLCLLASGSCLNLASFACIEFPFYQKSGLHTRGADQLTMDMGRFSSALIPAVRLLTLSIMRTKSSNQRMRANFYGSLSFLLRFAQSLTRAAGAMDDANQPLRQTSAECLSAITQAANTDDESHWSLSDTFSGGTDTVADGMAMLSLLCWDLSRGHTVAQMAAMTVLELLIAMDRSSTELITFLCSQGTLQCLVDTISTDLSALETFLLSASQITTAEDFGAIGQSVSTLDAESAAAATSIFHMYRTKMSLLCRTATTLTGAKRIAQTNLLQSLSNCAIFSAFTVASCYVQGVDSVLFGTNESLFYPNGTDRKASGEALAAWDRALLLLSSISTDETPTDEFSVLQYVVRLIAAIDPEDTSLTNENEITWSTVLLPAVRLFKSLLVTLGSTHVSVTRQAVDFLYTHSDALLAAENVPLSSILFTFLNRRGYAPNLIPVGARWLAEWIAAETSVVELFALVLRSTDHVATNVDEYCALQREVVQSRATRYVLGLISNLIGSNTDSGKGLDITRFQFSSEVDFSQFVCETQQMYLMQCSTSVLIAVLGQSVSVTGDSGTMLSLNLSKSSRLPWSVLTLFSANTTSEEDSSAILQLDNKLSSIQPGVHLIVSTLSWALRHIGRVEKICLNLANLGFFKTSATRPDSDETPSKTKYASRDSSLSGQMVLCLLQHDSCNWDLPTENLRQVVNSMFSIPTSALSSSSEPSVLGIDGHQREVVHLQNLISFGLTSLRAQLRSLISKCTTFIRTLYHAQI